MHFSTAFAFLCLVMSVGAQGSRRLTCYLDVLTSRTRLGPCTHLILPSITTDEELHLQSLTEEQSATLRRMKDRNPTLKILLGLEVKSSRLELMSADDGSVEIFTQTVSTYLKDKSLDGLDVIWLDGGTSSRSSELLSHFLKSLHGAFEAPALLLSVSVLEPVDHSALSIDEQTLSQYVDFISILPAQLEDDGSYINKTAQHWQDKQVDLDKLDLAMPGFVRRSHGRHHHRNDPDHQHTHADEENTDHIHAVNSHMGDQVCRAIKSGQEQFIAFTSLSDEQGLVEQVLQKGFGGVAVVLIDLDVFSNSICANITQDEKAIVESKAIMHSHHGHRRHGVHHHHHGREHHHHHSSHRPHGSREAGHPDAGRHHHGHRHHGRHHHGHRHHGHGHHHHHPAAPQGSTTLEGQGME